MSGSGPSATTEDRALLETTVILDRLKMIARREVIETLLEGYEWRFTTSIAVLEFKATIIQECIFLYNEFRLAESFTRVLDAVTESHYRQQPLRLHIVHNMIQVLANVPLATPDRDRVMAEMAAEQLGTIIPQLYQRCISPDHVDQVLRDRIGCDRAAEAPKKLRARFDTNLPVCKRGRNKNCRVEAQLRQHEALIRARFTPLASPVGEESPNQFRKTLNVLDRAVADPKADLSHGDCRRAGDCLIGIEGAGYATHALSTNKTEWQEVAPMMGMEFVHVTYPD